MVVVISLIPSNEWLEKLHESGCHDIMLTNSGAEPPAPPVKSERIDKFVLQDMWFDVIHDLPHQLEHGFDRISLLDKEGLSPRLSGTRRSAYGDDDALRARAQADLRLLYVRICRHEKHARRGKWVSIELGVINSAIVDLLVVLNDRRSYHRYSSCVTRLLHCPRGRESDWHTRPVLA